jgi:DNA-directed RNA polymerase beta' subunit
MISDVKEISHMSFGILSEEEIEKMSVLVVDNPKLSEPGSLYDPRFGSFGSFKPCTVCELSYLECPGHFGYINLNANILHPLYYRIIVSFLKCFCHSCYRLIILPEQLKLRNLDKLRSNKRFLDILEIIEKIDICCYCSEMQYMYQYYPSDNLIVKMSLYHIILYILSSFFW